MNFNKLINSLLKEDKELSRQERIDLLKRVPGLLKFSLVDNLYLSSKDEAIKKEIPYIKMHILQVAYRLRRSELWADNDIFSTMLQLEKIKPDSISFTKEQVMMLITRFEGLVRTRPDYIGGLGSHFETLKHMGQEVQDVFNITNYTFYGLLSVLLIISMQKEEPSLHAAKFWFDFACQWLLLDEK